LPLLVYNQEVKKIKKFVWSVLNHLKLGGSIHLTLNGALVEDGWFKSFYFKRSINKEGEPIPWYTYSFIKFIEPRLKKQFDAFEFGCGNSTLWYAQRIRSVKSVEHNIEWFNKMKDKIPLNALLVHQTLFENGDYAREVLAENKNYHLIIIDGEDRNNCLVHAVSKLCMDGVIIYDNSDRSEYNFSYDLLAKSGFKRIDFKGLGPIVNVNSCTTVFYRQDNCLGI
jgi:hypothetical protein